MLDTRPHLPHATEPLTTRWDTSTIEVERVRDELATLWVEWAYRYGESAAIVTGVTWFFRQFRRHPALTLIPVLTMACGIGAASSLAEVLEVVVLRPLPFHDENQLVAVYAVQPTQRQSRRVGAPWDRRQISVAGWEGLAASPRFADVGGTVDVGAVYLFAWPAGALPLAPTPRAVFAVPGAATGDLLGN